MFMIFEVYLYQPKDFHARHPATLQQQFLFSF
jgi:hypothetical protein